VSVVVGNLMSIGEFATASRLSQKALRLYGENGLLPPAWVDPDSGYRYYRPEQLRSATLIALLRRAGMPLVEIRTFLRDPTPQCLERYERAVADEFAERRRVLRYLKRILKEEPMYDVVTKQVGEQPYVSRTKRVLVPELEQFIVDTFRELGGDGATEPGFVLYCAGCAPSACSCGSRGFRRLDVPNRVPTTRTPNGSLPARRPREGRAGVRGSRPLHRSTRRVGAAWASREARRCHDRDYRPKFARRAGRRPVTVLGAGIAPRYPRRAVRPHGRETG